MMMKMVKPTMILTHKQCREYCRDHILENSASLLIKMKIMVMMVMIMVVTVMMVMMVMMARHGLTTRESGPALCRQHSCNLAHA